MQHEHKKRFQKSVCLEFVTNELLKLAFIIISKELVS